MPKTKSTEIWTLFETSGLSNNGDLNEYMVQAMQKCALWFDSSGASIFLKDDSGLYRLRAQYGRQAALPVDASVREGEGIAGDAIARRRPQLVNGPSEPISGNAIKSSMIVPLIAPDRECLGVLNLSRKGGKAEFTAAELQNVGAVANQIALAVRNAQLIKKLIDAKNAEAESAAALARVSRLAEIGQMTAAIAHEIRNPLTGIKSAAQMISQSPDHSAEFASIVVEEVDKLNLLCEEFLEFARPMELQRKRTDIAALVKRIVRTVVPSAELGGVELVVEIASDLPILNIDPLRIEQVIRNLLQNALQACSAGGKVTLSIGRDRLTIADNGVGMSDEELDKLFTPFFTTKPKGTGLGLCNVQKIVSAHGESISVCSSLGSGSKFEITLERAA